MNKEKTKIIWIGRKRFSREKLKVSVNMEWGASQFTMLGLDFFTNLNEIPKRNYDKAILKMRTVVKKWNNYYLTPFGKITIIKTNILSQCIHLLTVIPRSVEFLKEVNTISYNFLWSGKPDRINRSTTILQCAQGGMNMIDLLNFEKAIKVSWIKKIIFQTNSQWYKLLFCMYSDFHKILQFGDDWCTKRYKINFGKMYSMIGQP